ncbi:MAG: recombinase family protein, partial [Sporichthyaceae bacterium]|nr:recombinase family protein [Sporichthyaceae bacterium]
VCWHVDRLTRSPRELEDVIDLADRLGVELATVTGEIDLSSVTGRLVARMLGAAARHETEHKSERQRRKARQVAEAGIAHGGYIRPYGFEADRVTVVEGEAALIRDMARRVLAGESLRSVTLDLNRRGIPTVTGKQWSTQTVRGLLGSARISGRREYKPSNSYQGYRPLIGEITHDHAWPAIISIDESDRLRALLSRPERRTTPGSARTYLLSGILRCSKCGARMVGRIHNGKRRYNCITNPGRGGCGKIVIYADQTDAHVRDWVLTALDSPKFIAKLHRAGATGPDADQLAAKLRGIEERRDQLATDWAAGEITRREWQTARQALDAQAEQLHAQLAHSQNGQALAQLARLDGD